MNDSATAHRTTAALDDGDPADGDVVVVGAGINGMVAAAELARGGRAVTLVDGNDEIGGFIGSHRSPRTGHVHDTWSSNHALFVTGPAYAELGADLHRHGLVYDNTDGPILASVSADGTATLARRDPAATDFAHAEDAATYRAILDRFARNAAVLGPLLGGELREPGTLEAVARLGMPDGVEAYARDMATSVRGFCRRELRGPEVDHVWAPMLMHAGLSPDAAGGGFMLPPFMATLHGGGMPMVRGGSARFVAAFRALFDELGVRVLTGTTVDGVELRDGAVCGVRSGGTVLPARQVVASASPGDLYGRLLPPGAVPDDVRAQAASFRAGRAGLQALVSLSAPVPWRDPRLAGVPMVHLSDGSASAGIACAEAEAGLLPRHPTVAVGQESAVDPTRVPDGGATVRLQLFDLPGEPRADAAGRIEVDPARGWTPELADAVTERMLDQLAAQAPGLRELVLECTTIGPPDLQRRSPLAIGGNPLGGALELDQNWWWRPTPATARHRTPVPGLWHVGASTHPGPGTGGGSGHLVAQEILTS